ncbi:MAG: PEP/pyruvate-binding domain-containing protein [Promethearchaeota archaeon]
MAIKSQDSWIRTFKTISKSDITTVGGKGANLGELTRVNIPVPPGFCITTKAYTHFLESNKLSPILQKMMEDLEKKNQISQIHPTIETLFLNSSIPDDLIAEISRNISQIGNQFAYAVRSSATSEDLPDASFAGQLNSYLNIKGNDQIFIHVRKCWASLFTERVILYRKANEIDLSNLKISVIIQRMVNSEKSGIIFTADPVTQNRNVMTVDAGFGLGEALVSGLISADFYRIDKLNWNIIEQKISQKSMGIFPDPSKDTGVVEIKLEETQQSISTLSEDQCIALAKLAQKIETHYGSPQDIEWAIEKEEIFITQARPITTLFPLIVPLDGKAHLFLNFNYIQVMMDPVRPLGQSVLRMMLTRELDATSDECAVLHAAGNFLYADYSSILKFKGLRSKIKNMLSFILDQSTASAIQKGIDKLEDQIESSFKDRMVLRRTMLRIVPIGLMGLQNYLFRNPQKIFEKGANNLDSLVDTYRTQLATSSNNLSLVFTIERILHQILLHKVIYAGATILPGLILFRSLGKQAKKDGWEQDFNNLTRGLRGNITTEMDLEVASLTDLLIKAEKTKNRQEFETAFNKFLEKYGMRGPSEIDITRDRYFENQQMLLNIMEGNKRNKIQGDHLKNYEELTQKSHESVERIINSYKGLKKKKMIRKLDLFRACMPFREHPKYAIMRIFWLIKQSLLKIGRDLREEGWVETTKDIYYLRLPEIQAILECPKEQKVNKMIRIQEKIKKQKRMYSNAFKMNSPKVLTGDGEIMKSEIHIENYPEGAIIGSAVSTGIITGIAHIIQDPTREVLHKGEILVAKFTDPGWTPLFINAAALVMEVGGMMTHGSVIAREYGIPAVVGADCATQRIKTGQKIRVNGDLGFVEIIEQNF